MVLQAIESLKAFPNWVCWREQAHPTKSDKVKKPIISAVSGTNGSHSNPKDWTTYQKAKAFYYTNKDRLSLRGMGFVFSSQDNFVGIDLDNCILPDGELSDFAKRMLDTFPSYAEFSYSGSGIHIIGISDLLFPAITANKRDNVVEFYSKDRYFVVTGKHVPGTPNELCDITKPLSYRVLNQEDDDPTDKIITLEDVRDMLGYIPGEGLDYNEWLRVLMAVHSQFPGTDGLNCVENWTGRFCLPQELSQKWRSFRKGGVGIGTLVHFAKEYGYTTPHDVKNELKNVRPRLTPVQELQVSEIVQRIATQKAWEIYHKKLLQNQINIGYSTSVLEHFQIGYRERQIDQDTGEITPGAITVPYYMQGDVVAIEFREEDEHYTYEGESVGLYKVKPMFDEHSNFGVILPDTFNAINMYLSGTGIATIYGLPHTELGIQLPDKSLYCIFDQNTPVEQLEVLDKHGVKFVKVQSVNSLLKNLARGDIENIAMRGKKLSGVI